MTACIAAISALIKQVREAALTRQRAAVVITFFPHPSVVLGRAQPFYLTSPEEKLVQINQTGVDWLIELPFTPETAQVRAAEFVDQLIEHLHLRELWIGHDFALGYKREGNAEFLAQLGQTRGFTVHAVDPLTNDGEIISSSNIRAALREGDVAHAAHLLGRPFRVSGARRAGRRARKNDRDSHRQPGRVGRSRPARERRVCVPRVGGAHSPSRRRQRGRAAHRDR